jgi:hypothetical protein
MPSGVLVLVFCFCFPSFFGAGRFVRFFLRFTGPAGNSRTQVRPRHQQPAASRHQAGSQRGEGPHALVPRALALGPWLLAELAFLLAGSGQ